MLAEGLLASYCGRNRISRIREREEKTVALHLHLNPTARAESFTKQTSMLSKRPDVRLPTDIPQHPRRALDVGE
jgi:hypothetical protein